MNPPPPIHQIIAQGQPGFSMYTMSIIIALTLFLQGTLIGLSAYIIKSYKGIRAAAIATLSIALGFFIIAVDGTKPTNEFATITNFLILVGYALFYIAFCQFTETKIYRVVIFSVLIVGAVAVVSTFITDFPLNYYLYVRLIGGIIFNALTGGQLLIKKNHFRFNLTAYLTAFPLLAYALVLIGQLIVGIVSPRTALPGTSVTEKFSAIALFICSYLWSTGFILMIGQRLQNRLNDLAMNDALTRVRNRRAMDQLLDFEMERVHNEVREFSIILIDVDHFKRVNDSYGHEVGDTVLQTFASLLQNNLRVQDVVARWGGEEFLILLPDTMLDEAFSIADRLRSTVASYDMEMSQGTLRITFSAGVASSTTNRDVRLLCKVADDALYLAKEHRNQVKTQRDLPANGIENAEYDLP